MELSEARSLAAKILSEIRIQGTLKQRQQAAWDAIQASGHVPPYITEPWPYDAIAGHTRLDRAVVEAEHVIFILYCCSHDYFCEATTEHYHGLCVDYLQALIAETPTTSVKHWPVFRCCCTVMLPPGDEAPAEENG